MLNLSTLLKQFKEFNNLSWSLLDLPLRDTPTTPGATTTTASSNSIATTSIYSIASTTASSNNLLQHEATAFFSQK